MAFEKLILHQKVPNISENQAVGPIIKKITRTSPEFASLIRNTNTDIIFKNEERTGADMMMTKRLAGKLDVLARLVKDEFPGMKLRITEAWDENMEHNPTSTHYEGRAADLTTDPIDSTKLARLAGLAVQAGFDWVFFENDKHVHVSVKR
jgi:hedgehog signaling domain-containing protein